MKLASVFNLRTLPILGLSSLALFGCDKSKEAEKPKEEVLPNIQVQLPGSPNFSDAKSPEKWEDGAYSIYGLRSKIDERLKEGDEGTIITVKGYVQDIYVPPECPEGEMCAPGKQPHFWITDKPDEKGKKRAMMIVSYKYSIPEWEMANWKDVPEVVVEKGKQYKIRGRFKRFSDTGFAADTGLLDFHSYFAANPETGAEMEIMPPNSPQHPTTVAAQEEQNRKMQEKMQKDAQAYKNRGK